MRSILMCKVIRLTGSSVKLQRKASDELIRRGCVPVHPLHPRVLYADHVCERRAVSFVLKFPNPYAKENE
jgi:hypothetical protein